MAVWIQVLNKHKNKMKSSIVNLICFCFDKVFIMFKISTQNIKSVINLEKLLLKNLKSSYVIRAINMQASYFLSYLLLRCKFLL